jgi:lysophospholipase L1-like esterase
MSQRPSGTEIARGRRGTLNTMRIRQGAVLGVAMLACVWVASWGAPAPKKKKSRRPPAPTVSAAARNAALRRVDGYLEASAESPFAQPAALVPFFEQLVRAKSGEEKASPEARAGVHIIQWGDSHTAADDFTGGLRDRFQERFGDGGSGFSLAGRPFLGYRRFDARGGGTTGWHSEGLRSANGDGWFGLGGVSISAERAGQSVFLTTECDSLEVHFLQQPGGGRIALYDYDDRLDEISTDGTLAPGFARYATPPGPHRFLLRTLDNRPVRLFGWVADKAAGVTYEALGINGAEAGVILKWNEEMLATYVQRRAPALIVLAYGTNEASDPLWRHESYREVFARLVARMRAAAPTATILVLGPADRWSVVRGRWQLVAGIDDIVAAQRAVCRELGCVYWDSRARMGGPDSMRDWLYAGLAQGDRVHFNSAGYRKLASVLFSDLMQQFEAYRKARVDTSDPVPHDRPKQDR